MDDNCDCGTAEAKAKVAAYLTYRERRLDPEYNPYLRPHPDLPWVFRGLPWRSQPANTQLVDVGHQATVHDFPVTPAPQPGPRRVHIDRPERIQ